MQSSQSVALDLPLRLSIWEDERNRVWVSHHAMDRLAAEYDVKDHRDRPRAGACARAIGGHAPPMFTATELVWRNSGGAALLCSAASRLRVLPDKTWGGDTMTIARRTILAGGISLAAATAVRAQATYPDRPIRLVVPFPPGGVTDVVAHYGAASAAHLGQPVIVANKAGAAGVIGSEFVAKAPADGYMLLFTTPNHTINAAFRTAMSYDTEKDLQPVSIAGQVPMLLVSHPAAPFTTFEGFIDYAKKNPGKLNSSSAGNGTLPHIVMELLLLKTGIQVTNVPYRGAAPALADLVAGQVQLKFDTYATAGQFVADRKLNALAITSLARSKLLPNVPTVAETGAGLRGLHLDGHRGAGGHAQGRDRQTGGERETRRAVAGTARALRQGGHRSRRQHAGGIARPGRPGDRPMARSRQGDQITGRPVRRA